MKKANEAGFQTTLIQYAQVRNWRTAHFRPARTSTGWRTAVEGDGKGFPDLIMVRGGRLIVAELKMPGEVTSPDQELWIAAFQALAFNTHWVDCFVWTPADWPQIEEALR